MKPSLDVIVVNYHTPDDLKQFLDSYAQQRCDTHHLYIVNVEPTEEDRAVAYTWMATHNLYEVGIINLPENVGYGAAVNSVAALGTKPVLAIFNADVVLTDHSLDLCVVGMRDSGADILGPRQVDERGRVTHAGITGTNAEPKMRGWLSHSRDEYRDTIECVSVSGSAYFITRQAWQLLTTCQYMFGSPETVNASGAFLETPLYYEETWCSYHARAHDLKVVYEGLVEITHKWHRSIIKSGENEAARKMKIAREMFRSSCDAHGIEHD